MYSCYFLSITNDMKIKLVFLFVCLFVLSCKNTYNDIVEETISSEVLSIDSLIVGNALGMIYVDSFLLIADNRNDSLFYWVSLIEQSASQVGRVGNGPNDFLDFDNFYGVNNMYGFFSNRSRCLTDISVINNKPYFTKKVAIDSSHFRVVSTSYDSYIGIGPYSKGLFYMWNHHGDSIKRIGEQPFRDNDERRIPELARAMAYQGNIAVSPDSRYLVHAIYTSPIISFYRLSADNLEQIGYVPIAYPKYKPELGEDSYASAMNRHNKLGFMDVVATDKHIYALLSNRNTVEFGLSAFLGNTIMVYNWDGTLVRKLMCDYDLKCMCVTPDEETMYAIGLVDDYELLKINLRQK